MATKRIAKRSGKYDIDLNISSEKSCEIIDFTLEENENVQRKLRIKREKDGKYSLISKE